MKIIIKQLLYIAFVVPLLLQAQSSVSGTITDTDASLPLPGVNISILDTTRGVVTDFNGEFKIEPITVGQILVCDYLGFKTKKIVYNGEKTLNISLEEDVSQLSEVILIGYGSAQKENVTGAIAQVSEDQFNQGAIVSPQDLLRGKTAGVQVTSSGGDAGGGSRIRIRGGSSINATSDPLIVVDGIPLDQQSIDGVRNVLNIINPDDIKDFVVLKDAASTAIYGSRASNGVILITTKKGRKESPLEVTLDFKYSFGEVIRTIDVFNAPQFREFVTENGTAAQVALLNDNESINTDWQNAIFQTAVGNITNFTLSKGFKNTTVRASFNHSDQEGILLTDSFKRNSFNTTITHDLFDNNLKLKLVSKLAETRNRFADRGRIGSALNLDPTRPIRNEDGSFFTYPLDGTETQSPVNAVAALEQDDNRGIAQRMIHNFNAEYALPFVKGLKLNLNLGLDYTESRTRQFQDVFTVLTRGDVQGSTFTGISDGFNRNQLLETTVNYTKDFENIDTKIDAVAGYSYQEFFRTRRSTTTRDFVNPELTDEIRPAPSTSRNLLISYFSRVNVEFSDKYLISGSLRRDGSSRFGDGNQFGIFPGISVGWKLHNERFFENFKSLNQLKFRAGWGITGQQEISQSFPFLSVFQPSQDSARVQFGDQFVTTQRPGPLNQDLKWEQTSNFNIGLDFGFFNNRLSGSVDVYEKKTSDLLFEVPFPSGIITANRFVANVGELTNRGVEFSVNGDVFSSKDFNWNLAYNVTFNENEVDRLTSGSSETSIPIAGISGGRGNTIQVLEVGFDPTSYSTFRQVFDADGRPIEGAYVDVNRDGIIDNEDRVTGRKANPDVFMGLTSTMNYKDFDFSFTFRGAFGGYNYNNIQSNAGNIASALDTPGSFVVNLPSDFVNTNFQEPQLFSDIYLQSSDFVRLDNVSLGYTFDLEKVKIRLSATGSNLLTITDYDGLDPEVVNGLDIGVDNNAYPRPRSYVFGVNVKF